MTFGQFMVECRTGEILSQKDLAAQLHKEDGEAISPQYLNDIEHDRRNPPGEYLLRQLAEVFGLPLDYLLFKAGRWPKDLYEGNVRLTEFHTAFDTFRQTLQKNHTA